MSKINLLVTGANGQLGNELKRIAGRYPKFEFTWTDISELDISSPDAIKNFVKSKPQNIFINCAAYTAVDKAESESNKASLINTTAVKNLAKVAHDTGSGMIHISTDFVFDGFKSTPYNELDKTNPLSVYGKTKFEGEKYALEAGIVIRTSWLYSTFGNNFMKTILRLANDRKEIGIVFDQIGTPTLAADLASAIMHICDCHDLSNPFPVNELYNYSNEGVCSWYDFAHEIIQNSGLNCRVDPIETFEYPLPARRPAYSVLNKRKIREKYSLLIPHWRESLKNCMKDL